MPMLCTSVCGLLVPQLHVRRRDENFVRAVARARHVRRRAIERNRQDDDAGVVEVGGRRRGAAELADGRRGRTQTAGSFTSSKRSLGTGWPSMVMTRDGQREHRRLAARRAAAARWSASALASSGSAIVASACTDDPRRVGRQLAPALRLLEARARGAAEMRHVGDDLQRVAVAADLRRCRTRPARSPG